MGTMWLNLHLLPNLHVPWLAKFRHGFLISLLVCFAFREFVESSMMAVDKSNDTYTYRGELPALEKRTM